MDIAKIDAPLCLHRATIRPDWIDYNGHMNVAYYVLIFDHATDGFFDYLGLTEDYRRDNNASTFALEAHVNYLRELHEGDAVRIETHLLDHDHRRMHFFHTMIHEEEGHVAATSEWINTHVDMATRRSADFFPPVEERLAAILKAHAHLEPPPNQGHVIGIQRR
jgi:acyl-CoA thioester hydrolase